jgi:hypothetical protein
MENSTRFYAFGLPGSLIIRVVRPLFRHPAYVAASCNRNPPLRKALAAMHVLELSGAGLNSVVVETIADAVLEVWSTAEDRLIGVMNR